MRRREEERGRGQKVYREGTRRRSGQRGAKGQRVEVLKAAYAAHGGYQCERSVHASARCCETLTTTLTLP